MGTTWSARIAVPRGGMPGERAKALDHGIADMLATVIAQMSNWEAASDISRFNHAPLDRRIPLPDAFMTVLRAGLDIAGRSGGAFDPAIGHAVDRWGFGPAGRAAILSATPPTSGNWRAIVAEDGGARRLADVALDFSGIAKGHAVDRLAELLIAQGLRHFLVEIGGELRGAGVRPDGQPWWVELEMPPGIALGPVRVALCGLSVATSGDYRRWFEADGRRYSHSIDPRTGRPIANGVASVTVLHQSAMMADAWATALTVLGPDEGLALAAREGLAMMMIARTGGAVREMLSPGFAAMLD
ncbi:FAD:protein FMN transferase [Sphingobium aquiterrae]|uniref:FAD:protein FMN transferase n=1 Tax=Sphingobium aquiterrae TaxID=2038656 RepID=UPI003AFB0626